MSDAFDPRDAWQHARRIELVRYASEIGHPEIVEQMPKNMIVEKLKALGVPPPSVPLRPLMAPGGNYDPRSGDTTPVSHRTGKAPIKNIPDEIDADELLAQEWSQKKPVEQMGWHEMRAELKARGIKIDRKWTKDDVRKQLGV